MCVCGVKNRRWVFRGVAFESYAAVFVPFWCRVLIPGRWVPFVARYDSKLTPIKGGVHPRAKISLLK